MDCPNQEMEFQKFTLAANPSYTVEIVGSDALPPVPDYKSHNDTSGAALQTSADGMDAVALDQQKKHSKSKKQSRGA